MARAPALKKEKAAIELENITDHLLAIEQQLEELKTHLNNLRKLIG